MTVIAAVEATEGVAFAWDTVVTDSDHIDVCGPKGWLARPWLGVAMAGGVALERVIRYSWTPPMAMPVEVERWVVWDLAHQWAELLDNYKEASKGEIVWDFEAIVALGGLAWSFGHDLTAHRSPRGYASIGSGRAWAEGALGALVPIQDAREATKKAVMVTCEHAVGFRAPDGPGTLWVPSHY